MYFSGKEVALTEINNGPASPLAHDDVQREIPLRPPMIDKILAWFFVGLIVLLILSMLLGSRHALSQL